MGIRPLTIQRVTSNRHSAVCSARDIRAVYQPGLRIVWEEAGEREVWEILDADDNKVTTRITTSDGDQVTRSASFEELSDHSAFPIGPTKFHSEAFETPAGRFTGTHCVVLAADGDQHFYFSDQHPGPPIRIEGPGALRQQIERSDVHSEPDEPV